LLQSIILDGYRTRRSRIANPPPWVRLPPAPLFSFPALPFSANRPMSRAGRGHVTASRTRLSLRAKLVEPQRKILPENSAPSEAAGRAATGLPELGARRPGRRVRDKKSEPTCVLR